MTKPTRAAIDAILAEALAAADTPLGDLGDDLEWFDDLECFVQEFDREDLDFVPTPSPGSPDSASAPPAIRVPHGTVKISVRIPGRILAAFKTRAAERRQPYQKLLNQALRDTVKGWKATAKA